jgi:hypothetical protein
MTLKCLLLTFGVLLGATTVTLAQSQPNCGPNAPAGDTFGTPTSGTLGGQAGARRCQERNYRHSYRHHRHRHTEYSSK